MTAEGPRHFQAVIIGGGPAGLTAGIYCARQGLDTAIVAGEVGGQAAWAAEVENYLGWQLITGPELVDRFREHVSQFDVECMEGRLVNALMRTDEGFALYTREGTELTAETVIIATGRSVERLSVPGEEELAGHGVSYCATCDAAFFKGKRVAVVGPGESAADAALQLADLDATVHLISRGELKAPRVLLDAIDADDRIDLRVGARVERIEGEERVESIVVVVGPERERLEVDGVFVETGSIPVAEFTAGLVETNERGEIVVDRDGSTGVPGLFAAGDVTDDLGKQIIIAAGEGARAAIAAYRYLRRK